MSEYDQSPLMELCEPVFSCVCEVRSRSETMQPLEAADAVQAALVQAETQARVRGEIEKLFALIKHDLYFFADHVLAKVFENWRSIAAERLGIVAGDEIFCHDLEEMLDEPDERREELTVLRTCIGLGFDGGDAVGAARWRQDVKALARALPLHSPDSPASAGRMAGGRRQGPSRRKWWPIFVFAWLSLMLLTLAAWQILRAPALYRQRLSRLEAAAGLWRDADEAWTPSPGTEEK